MNLKADEPKKKRTIDNLIPANKRTKAEASMLGRRGGVMSGKVRAQKQTFKELAQTMLNMATSNEKMKMKVVELFPQLTDSEITNRAVILAATVKKATKGDLRAVEVVRDTAGEQPISRNENLNITMSEETALQTIARLKKELKK